MQNNSRSPSVYLSLSLKLQPPRILSGSTCEATIAFSKVLHFIQQVLLPSLGSSSFYLLGLPLSTDELAFDLIHAAIELVNALNLGVYFLLHV